MNSLIRETHAEWFQKEKKLLPFQIETKCN